jgi:L-lactate dehydrogenase complex protein LldE
MSTLPQRPSPVGKRVSLFVTCIADLIYPHTGLAVVNLLEHLGLAVNFPTGQTCCGQPAFNGGYRDDARRVAYQFLRAFQESEVIVAPSGSCVAMVRHEYPVLFAGDPWQDLAEYIASITWEFTEFITDGLGITDLDLALPQPDSFAFHDSCHGLRVLGVGQGARTLLGNVQNATIHELPEHDVCCGFGGLFSVKMPDVSASMLRRKIANIEACPADTIVTLDTSCLTQMNGGLTRVGSAKRVRHIADVLADGLP